jgi:hypothetical protein
MLYELVHILAVVEGVCWANEVERCTFPRLAPDVETECLAERIIGLHAITA